MSLFIVHKDGGQILVTPYFSEDTIVISGE